MCVPGLGSGSWACVCQRMYMCGCVYFRYVFVVDFILPCNSAHKHVCIAEHICRLVNKNTLVLSHPSPRFSFMRFSVKFMQKDNQEVPQNKMTT